MKLFNLLILLSFTLIACQQMPTKKTINQIINLPIPQVVNDNDQDSILDDKDQCLNTPQYIAIYANGCSAVEKSPVAIEYRALYSKDERYPALQYLDKLEKIVYFMKKYPNSGIQFEGHASKAEKNPEKISRERAKILAQILKEKYGIDESRISIKFYGAERPIADNKTAEGQAINQRVYAIAIN